MVLPHSPDIFCHTPSPPSSSYKPLNIAIILAGGSGSRAAQNSQERRQPKQFWDLAGLPLWQHSWLRYASHPAIHKVCLVWPESYVEQIQAQLDQHPKRSNLAPSYVIAGGLERSDSSYNALKFCQQWQDDAPQRRIQVLIHDAARPLVSKRMIDETLEKLQTADAVVCAIPSQDSLFVKDSCPVNPADSKTHQRVTNILDRTSVMQSQTPQSFELQTLHQAFALHQQYQNIQVTDDISLVKNYLPSIDIHVVHGEIYNIKLTQPLDINILMAYYETIATKI